MVSTGELRQAKREPIFHPTSNRTPDQWLAHAWMNSEALTTATPRTTSPVATAASTSITRRTGSVVANPRTSHRSSRSSYVAGALSPRSRHFDTDSVSGWICICRIVRSW
jgi:hypothetical protein